MTWKDKTIVCSNIFKKIANYSSLVFAGFCEKELFPSVIIIMIYGKINYKLKYAASSKLSKNVNAENLDYIIPYAEADTVRAFITGIDDNIENFSLIRLE